jgi:hypothetical protein
MPRLRRSDWIVSFDVDEFICVNAGEGRMSDLFDAVPNADFISMNQLNFGCSGVETYDPDTCSWISSTGQCTSLTNPTVGIVRAV